MSDFTENTGMTTKIAILMKENMRGVEIFKSNGTIKEICIIRHLSCQSFKVDPVILRNDGLEAILKP